jgi:hypothetical protein
MIEFRWRYPWRVSYSEGSQGWCLCLGPLEFTYRRY